MILCTIMHHLVLPLYGTFEYIRDGHFVSLDGCMACVGDITQDYLIGPICFGASLPKYIWFLDESSSTNTYIWSLFVIQARRAGSVGSITKPSIEFYFAICSYVVSVRGGCMVVRLKRTP